MNKRSLAFTLLELLVVMTITTLLASLLLPALNHGRELARRAKCFSNERQLLIAWTMYSDETGRIAGNGVIRGGGDETRPMWVQGYLNHHLNFQDGTNAALLVDARFSQFSPYINNVNIYKCPSDRGGVIDVPSGTKIRKLRSYAMNCFMGWIEGGGWKPKGSIFHKENSILSPADKFVFLDLHPESVCWPFFGVETNDLFFNYPGIHHLGTASVSFADGHVSVRRRADPRTADYPQDRAWHDHHHLSPGNKDLAWLRTHARREE